MRYLLYFLTALIFLTATSINISGKQTFTSQSFGANTAGSKVNKQLNQPINKSQIDSIITAIHLDISQSSPTGTPTSSDIVIWLLRIFGSFITTLLMYFLHRWFPNIFPTSKISAYIPPDQPPKAPKS